MLGFRLNALKISLRSSKGLQFWVFELLSIWPVEYLTCCCRLLCLTYWLAWLASGWELPAQLISGSGLIWIGSAPDLCLSLKKKYPHKIRPPAHGRTIQYQLDDVMFIDLLFSFEHIHCLFLLIMWITVILQLGRIQLCSLFKWRINKKRSFIFLCFLRMQPHLLKHKNLFSTYILYPVPPPMMWQHVVVCLFVWLTISKITFF